MKLLLVTWLAGISFFCPLAAFGRNAGYTDVLSKSYAFYLKGLMDDYYSTAGKALDDYSHVEKLDSKSISARLRIAAEYIKMNKYQQAVAVLEEAKKIDPASLDVYLLLVLVYTAQGDSQKANTEYEAFLNKAYSLEPENIKILEYLAQFECQKGNNKKAELLYRKVIQKRPGDADGYFWLGYVLESQGRWKEAVKQWQETLKIDPKYADALNSLGYLYAEEGVNLDEAEVMLKKALSLSPDNPAYLDSLGWIYFKQGKLAKAEIFVRKASKLLKDPVILEHLGDIYFKMGRPAKAVDIWKGILALDGVDKGRINKKIKKAEIKNAQ